MKKMCQSCGMPMRIDPKGGGSEVNGTKSVLYCSYCYAEGQFINPEITSALEMQEFVKKMLRKQGMGPLKAWVFTRQIPHLDRWK